MKNASILSAACLIGCLLACGASTAPPPGSGSGGVDAAVPASDAGGPASSDAGAPDAGSAAGDAGTPARATLAGCAVFPPGSPWNRDISGDPVDARSAEYLAFMGAGSLKLHPDFGALDYGLPFTIVNGSQPRVPMTFLAASESDPGPYPFPLDLRIQPGEDHHGIVLEKDHCVLYETFATQRSGDGYYAEAGAVFDLSSDKLRPDQWTSANAAGLPILPGLARYDEVVEKGEVLHALSFFTSATAHAFVHPATHSSGTSDSPNAPPMGLRVRLRADFDLSRYTGPALVMLRAMKRYGMYLVDNANLPFWSLPGTQDSRWPTQDLEQLKSVPASAFEVVRLGEVVRGR
jgi:hypothetical protein